MNTNKPTPANEGKPMTPADHRRWREGFSRWMAKPERRRSANVFDQDEVD